MTEYVIPQKNDASGFIFYVALEDQANAGKFKANPTLAAGDVQISKDGGAFANLGTLPAADPASGVAVKVTLSQAEINADNLTIKFIDAAGDEWYDLFVNLQTATNKLEDMSTFDASSDEVDADVVKIGGDAQSATDLKDFADAGYDPATNKVEGVKLADTVTALTGHTAQTGDTFALANGAAGFVAIDTVVDAIKAVTDNLPNSGALTDLATAAALSTVDTVVDAIKAVTDNLPNSGALTDLATAAALEAVAADLPVRLTKNTAFNNFMFKMVDATDGYTAETGLTPTCQRSIDGAAFGNCANAPSEVGSGWYDINLDAADLNGDIVVLRFTDAAARDTEFTVILQKTA